VVFVPVGVGVREILLVATLSPAIGTGGATAVALVSRALTTAGDLITAAAAAAGGQPAALSASPAPADQAEPAASGSRDSASGHARLSGWHPGCRALSRDYTYGVCTLPLRVLNMALALSL